jgi:abnormal spindle-like microcephaly-associated protein
MNPSDFAKSSIGLRQPPRRPRQSIQPHTSIQASEPAPEGVVSLSQRLLHERQFQHGRKRAPFSELRMNGDNSFGREASPDVELSHALRAVRDLDINDTTTNLINPAHKVHNATHTLDIAARHSTRDSLAARPAARRPVSAILAERLAATSGQRDHMEGAGEETQALLRREARRRTIYVPDDTTVLTIHPGGSLTAAHGKSSLAAQRAVRRGSILQKEQPRRRKSVMPTTSVEEERSREKDETTALPNLTLSREMVRDAVQEPEMRDRRKSLAVAPRRMKIVKDVALPTLQEDSEVKQHSASVPEQRAARPPLVSNRSLQNIKLDSQKHSSETKFMFVVGKPKRQSLAAGHKRPLSVEDIHLPLGEKVNSIVNSSVSQQGVKSMASINTANGHARSQSHHILGPTHTSSCKSSVQSNGSKQQAATLSFSILQEDLAHPELYEEDWLEHQEIAMTQLLNAFFQATDPDKGQDQSQSVLREMFLKLYNSSEMSQLVRRLQASLTYGSLTVPKELLARSIRLREDVGQRRKHLSLFLDGYDLSLLQAAAEAVAGRKCEIRVRTSTESTSESDSTKSLDRRSLEAFIDQFFIQHTDVSESKAGTIAAIARDATDQIGSPVWAWRRTTIRSLMLILLLDMAKSLSLTPICLFQQSSVFKSSETIVKELGTILLPSYGDLMRPLKYLKYEVSVVQQPLEEYNFVVTNLAVDLRDGIRLTRIVEIILREFYTPKASDMSQERSSTPNLDLSQNLKYPCISRTQKLHNAMTALSALVHLPSVSETLLKEVTAFDIVDGHREKSLSLLWSLLAQFSMSTLVDWQLLKREIDIARAQLPSLPSIDVASISPTTLESCWTLLFLWAQSLAAMRSITVTNLTTSFASGAAFTAIVDTYAPYFPTVTTGATSSVSDTLRAIGCSSSFTNLVSTTTTRIPTQPFTLTSLTFLASRLLPAARTFRAASTIQRFYTRIRARREVHRRVVLMRLASHCAAVVNARDRVVGAAVVLQRAWRAVLARKIAMLEDDVRMFQAVARGWLVRSRRARKGGLRAGW